MLTAASMRRQSAWIALCAGWLILVSHTAARAVPSDLGASGPRITAGDGTWTENHPGPRERSKQVAVYDSLHARMIMFGGRCQDACCPNGPVGDDVWILMLDSTTPRWGQIHPAGTSPASDNAHTWPAAAGTSMRWRTGS